jgi:hypothetical protein
MEPGALAQGIEFGKDPGAVPYIELGMELDMELTMVLCGMEPPIEFGMEADSELGNGQAEFGYP